MKQANRLLDMGDTMAAIPILLQAINEETQKQDAPLIVARLYYEKGNHDDALTMYNKAMEIALRMNNDEFVHAIRDEMEEKGLIKGLSEKNVYRLASYYEQLDRHEEAVTMYGIYIQIHRSGLVRPKAIYRTHLLFKHKLNDEKMAQNALAFLHKEYPDWAPR
jgi:tetratricopeptide (TPR) repeat protein